MSYRLDMYNSSRSYQQISNSAKIHVKVLDSVKLTLTLDNNNNKSISIAPRLQVTLFKGAVTTQIKKTVKMLKDKKNIKVKKNATCSWLWDQEWCYW